MKRCSIQLLGVALLLSGCANRTYEKAGMTPAQLDRDWKECADLQLRIEGSMGGRVHSNGDPEEYSKPCMEKKGYRQVFQ